MEAFKEADEQARRFRLEGVPFFIINGKITLSGAQQPDAFWAAIKQLVSSANRGDNSMNERRTPRKPATKFPNLRKKLAKNKVAAKQTKKK